MARVYKAHQESLDREVAIKVLPPWYAADRSFVERFNLEAKLVARLSHPNIVTVHDASEQNGHLYIVMQLVDGGTLKHRLDQLQAQRRFMETAEALPIFIQLASALSYAHEQGVVHRDVKPVNVLMDRSGRPILSDFGIAKVLAGTKEQFTRPGAGVGTPEYMSPEQCMGGVVDGRADIYALGVMLFEALTGRTPFIGDNYPVLAHSHIYNAPPRPSSLNSALSSAIEQIILTALMKDPSQRYQHASDMAEALELVQLQPRLTTGHHPATISQIGKTTPFVGAVTQVEQGNSTPPLVYENSPTRLAYPRPSAQGTESYACPHCQQLNRPQMRFCTKCGYPMNQCTLCGGQNPANNRFCTKCGQPLVRQTG
jgi:serine/threonine-protein kinase